MAAWFFAGYFVGSAPFLDIFLILMPGLFDLILLIPQGLPDLLSPMTGVLSGLLILSLRLRAQIGSAFLRKLFRVGTAGLPLGLALLAVFQGCFVIRRPFDSGRKALSIIVGPQRAPEPACPCPATLSDQDCVKATVDLEKLDDCWGHGPIQRRRIAWSAAYLVFVAGICSLLGWLRLRSGAPAAPDAVASAGTIIPVRRIFLSYSSRDGEFVQRLAGDLAERGVAVWKDDREIETGESLPQEIGNAIAGSLWFGVVLSPDAVASRWVRLEIDTAITLEVETGAAKVLPILFRSCEIPAALRGKKRAEFYVSYEKGLAALLGALGC